MLLVTTTVTVERSSSRDPYEAADDVDTPYEQLVAHISAPSGNDTSVGGDAETITAVAYLPAHVTIERSDQLVDDRTGMRYAVAWSQLRRGLGLDHVHVGLRAVTGGSNG